MATVSLVENCGTQRVRPLLQRSSNEHGVLGSAAEQSAVHLIGAFQWNPGEPDFTGQPVPDSQRCRGHSDAFRVQSRFSRFPDSTMELERSTGAYEHVGGGTRLSRLQWHASAV